MRNDNKERTMKNKQWELSNVQRIMNEQGVMNYES